MVIEQIVQEEKPVDQGVPLQEAGVPVQKLEGRTRVTVIAKVDEEGRKYLDMPKGGRRYFCDVEGCGRRAVSRARKCRRHQEVGQGTIANLSVMPELRLVKNFIKGLIASRDIQDPKLHVKLTDLEKSVTILAEKLAAGVTIEQLRQCGFYFASTLFQYITDGNRYEMAKKEFIENMKRVGCFTELDIEGMLSGTRNSIQSTTVS